MSHIRVIILSLLTDNGDIKVLLNVSEHVGGKGLPTETIFAEDVPVMIMGGLGPKVENACKDHKH